VKGSLVVGESEFEFHRLQRDASITFKVPVRVDGHFAVSAKWDNGRTLTDSTGYVTHGLTAAETLEVRSEGLTLAGARFR